ncbi:MAG: TSUP family transporter, partial [Candidatus Methylomirabilis sp.]|nr:TSUP family transporter [Deltaproteobacteria bacterium]
SRARPPPPPRPISRAAVAVWLGIAGVIHGIWASGGPPLVYAISRLGIAKGTFRATLAALWFAMDAILLVNFLLQGAYDRTNLLRIALLLPLIPLSIRLGDALHHRVSERSFRIVIFALLLFAGAGLVLR